MLSVYGSSAIIHILIISVSYRRQILTYKDGPRAENGNLTYRLIAEVLTQRWANIGPVANGEVSSTATDLPDVVRYLY